MAQTKRKRRSKHRGTAGGFVESRGRTGRKPGAGEGPGARDSARQRRLDRLDRPPSWRSALNRAAIATAIFVVAVLVLFKEKPGTAIGLAAFVMVIYVPMGYYTDLFIYRRRQRNKAKGGS
jgi:hypothetical protein